MDSSKEMAGELKQRSFETEINSTEQGRSDLYHNKKNGDNDRLMARESPATFIALQRLESGGHHFHHLSWQSFSKELLCESSRRNDAIVKEPLFATT